MKKEWRMFRNVTIWLIMLGILLWSAVGCKITHIPGKLTVISFLSDSEFKEAYIETDPNGVMWLVKYDGDTARLEFDPLTRKISIGKEK